MSEKMWAGRFQKKLNAGADDFNSSIRVDSQMIKEDIFGSICHATMLGKQNIISSQDAEKIISGLQEILDDIITGKLEIDYSAEDVHMFVEGELTKRIGDAGKKVHTARSRNDQVAFDERIFLKGKIELIQENLKSVITVLKDIAKDNVSTIMCGYTHLQRAQPVTLAHHLLAYVAMFMRDYDRLSDVYKRTNVLPLGACALAGTTFNTDRHVVAKLAGFDDVGFNSMDCVSDRDYIVELAGAVSIIMMHLSRLCEEIILWASWEFKYVEISDEFSTGSSIMPQKKNPDIAELIRGKTGRVYGNNMSILTIMKSLPLAYNKDMQEDKEGIFDSVDTVMACLDMAREMLSTCKFLPENMLKNAKKGFINATDVADYLAKKGMPFRTAYKITGELVWECVAKNIVLEELSLKEFKVHTDLFEEDIYNAIDLKTCLEKRTSYGGPSEKSVKEQIKLVEEFLK